MHNTTPDDNLELVPLTDGELEVEFSEMEAISVTSLLAANGINAIMIGTSQIPSLPYGIQVPASQLNDAVRILLDARATGPEGAAEAEKSSEASGID